MKLSHRQCEAFARARVAVRREQTGSPGPAPSACGLREVSASIVGISLLSFSLCFAFLTLTLQITPGYTKADTDIQKGLNANQWRERALPDDLGNCRN